ncbi:hypothetical protein [Aridibaculum aurantiacum]|uniref:hypothetical protein n=1 Tax=Aridibaculum aurantiacum TaxID=2810307 RepID=UPI001A9684B4|nr:hypothetical protein [Aridibaculum aurantiacum]
MKPFPLQRLAVLVYLSFFIATGFTSCLKSMARASHNSKVSPDEFNRLKGKTVVFVVPKSEYASLEDYKELLPKAWTLTPMEVIRYSDIDAYADPSKYAFFQINGITTTTTNSRGFSYSNTHYYLALSSSYSTETKKGKEKQHTDVLCRVELYPEFAATGINFSAKDASDKIYENVTMRNFSVPYMMAYVRFVQKNLQNKKNPWVYENYSDDVLRDRIKTDTLYVPENVLFSRSKFTGKEAAKGADFFAKYDGRYKIVSNKELTEIVRHRNPKKPLFLFEYVQSSTDKYVGVLEVNSGTVAYRRYTGVTYNLKSKDLKRI